MHEELYKNLKESFEKLSRNSPHFSSRREEQQMMRRLKENFDLLYNFAIKDGKTGLYNSRYFAEELKKEIARAMRYKHSFSLLMLDLDNFKQVNDRFGHAKGDEVLKKTASIISSNLRQEDTPCRFGGEEFTVLLPETDEQGAFRTAEKLRRAVLTDSFLNQHEVTISIGLVSLESSNIGNSFQSSIQATPHEIFKKADSALMWAKQHGKNQTKIYSREM